MFRKKYKDFSDDTEREIRDNCYQMIKEQISNKKQNKEIIELCDRELKDIERNLNQIISKIRVVINDLKAIDAEIKKKDDIITAIESDYNDTSLNRRKLSNDFFNGVIDEEEFFNENAQIDDLLQKNKNEHQENIESLCRLNEKKNALLNEYMALINKKRELVEKKDRTKKNKKNALRNIKLCDININKITSIETRVDDYAFSNATSISNKDINPKLRSMKKIRK